MTPDEMMKRAKEISKDCGRGKYNSAVFVADEYVRLIHAYTIQFRSRPFDVSVVDTGGLSVEISDHAKGRISERIPGSKSNKLEFIKRAVRRSYSVENGRREAVSDGSRWLFGMSEDPAIDLRLITVVPL